MDNCGSRLVGCTDGFDSSHAHSKMMLSMFAMVHEHFVDQLRGKVRRGTDDAFRMGNNIRPPSFGYKLVPCLDAEGCPIVDTKGRVDVQKVVDDEHVEWVIKAFEMYVDGRKSPSKIAAFFNDHEVGGRKTWDGPNVTQLLTRRTYIGEEVEGMTRNSSIASQVSEPPLRCRKASGSDEMFRIYALFLMKCSRRLRHAEGDAATPTTQA